MDVLSNPNLERDYYDYSKPAFALERKAQRLRAKAEREFFTNNRMSHWDYEELLKKIDEYVKIWTKRNNA